MRKRSKYQYQIFTVNEVTASPTLSLLTGGWNIASIPEAWKISKGKGRCISCSNRYWEAQSYRYRRQRDCWSQSRVRRRGHSRF